MKEKTKTIIFISVAFVVLIGVFILSNSLNKSYIEEITYEEYLTLKESNDLNYIYTGDEISTSVKAELNSFGKDKDTTIYYVNTDTLSEEEMSNIENDNFTILNDGEEEKYDIKLNNVTAEEYLKLIKEKGFHLMFIGSEYCSYCTKFKESISVAQLFNHFDVYYIDLSSVSEDDYKKITDSDTYLQGSEWGTPTTMLYKDGEKIGMLPGYVSSDELISFLEEYEVI